VLAHLPDRALEALRDPLEQPEKFSPRQNTMRTELSVIAARRLFSGKIFRPGDDLLRNRNRPPSDDPICSRHVQPI